MHVSAVPRSTVCRYDAHVRTRSYGKPGDVEEVKNIEVFEFIGRWCPGGVTLGIRDTIPTCFGCLEIKKSRSYAQRLISARIFTEEGVTRSPSAAFIAQSLGARPEHVEIWQYTALQRASIDPSLEECQRRTESED